MAPPKSVQKERVKFTRVLVDASAPNAALSTWEEYRDESRATRTVGDSTRFLLVGFKENKSSRQGPSSSDRNNGIWSWLQRYTNEPLVVNDRKYTYLGFTEGQLKEGKVTFFEEGSDWTVISLKAHFGDLYPVYKASGYGKYAARLGLSFSGTVASFNIPLSEACQLEDLRAKDGTVSSDGCGLIRNSFATQICEEMKFPLDTSVFQIRRGGIKGVLLRLADDQFNAVLHNARISNYKRVNMAYRPSMLKYLGGPTRLEIQGISSSPRAAKMNRMFIVLLLTLGIEIKAFEDLLKLRLEEIATVLVDREKAIACVDGELDAGGNGFDQELYEMLLAGHSMDEPHLNCLLRRFQNRCYTSLRDKLQIPVKDSVYLYGVCDPLGILKNGQVFVNVPSRGGPQIGKFVVGRNPAYLPSDLRIMTSIDVPELGYMTNCIVFASNSDHSETDYMGGGDLDGDMYIVITDKNLVPSRSNSSRFRPKARAKASSPSSSTPSGSVSYQPSPPRITSRIQERRNAELSEKSIEIFINLNGNSLLGCMSTVWMDTCSSTAQLAASQLCLALTENIEKLLDIAKAGGDIHQLWSEYHNFKKEAMSARKQSGYLDPLEVLRSLIPKAPHLKQFDFDIDPDLDLGKSPSLSDKWNISVFDARKLMAEFNRGLNKAIRVDEELDAVAQSKHAIRDRETHQEEKRTEAYKRDFVNKHFAPMKNELFDMPQYCIKASSWYVVGYQAKKETFAWLGARYLHWLKACATNGGHMPISVGRSQPIEKLDYTPAMLSPISDISSNMFSPSTTISPLHDDSGVASDHGDQTISSGARPSSPFSSLRNALRRNIMGSDKLSDRATSPSLTRQIQDMSLHDDARSVMQRCGKPLHVMLDSNERVEIVVSRRPDSPLSKRSSNVPSISTSRPVSTIREISLTSSLISESTVFSTISVANPRKPVVTAVPRCVDAPDHVWQIRANQFVRTYKCASCTTQIKEKKDESVINGWRTL